MQTRVSQITTIILAFLVFGGAGTENSFAQHSRRSPIVEVVQKTRAAIVTVNVEKRGNWGRKEIVGTGVVVDGRGFVVTNSHVISGAERIVVHTAGGEEYVAKVHIEDVHHDLAILKLPIRKRLPELSFAPSSDLMVGETLIALGHPFGYTNTVSTGIVSALGREITMPSGETLTNLIQTDASINPGNSGGPLLNINGELVGINVALREGAQGIAFALPAETVQQVLARYLSAANVGHVTHGLVCRESVTEEEGPARQHVVVDKVIESSPAALAGVRRGDVIVCVGERLVSNRFDVERMLWDIHAGEPVEARLLRNGQGMKAVLTLTKSGETEITRLGGSRPTRPAWTMPEQAQPVKNSH